LSIDITERRSKLLGHILRLPPACPARKVSRYSFEERTTKNFKGRKRPTIVMTINNDIKRTKRKISLFSNKTALITIQHAEHLYQGKQQNNVEEKSRSGSY